MAIKINLAKRTGDTATILVNVTDDRGRPVDQQPVELLVAGARFQHDDTNDSGDAIFNDVPIDQQADSVIVAARTMMGGRLTEKSLQINKPASQKAKKPSDLELKSSGKDGKWTIFATIVAEDGTGVLGTIVIMRAGEKISREATDPNGTKEIAIDAADRQEEIRFLVAGTNIDKKLVLYGPAKTSKFFPRLTDADKAGGFWDAFKAGAKGK